MLILSSSSAKKETEVKLYRSSFEALRDFLRLSARLSSPLWNGFFICSLGIGFLPFLFYAAQSKCFLVEGKLAIVISRRDGLTPSWLYMQ